MVRDTLKKVQDGTSKGTLGEVRDRFGNPRGGPGQVEGTSGRSRTGRRNLGAVQDGPGDNQGGPGRVERPLGRCGTGWGTLKRSGTDRGTLWAV